MKIFRRIFTAILLSGIILNAFGQPTERPFIWATAMDRSDILNKIENNAWANEFYNKLVSRVEKDLDSYNADPKKYLSALPFDNAAQKAGKLPPFRHLPFAEKPGADKSLVALIYPLLDYSGAATDCAIIYYLSGDEKYAQYAMDILHNIVLALIETEPNWANTGRGGWIFPDDHLRELRYMANLPITYDFLAPYIKKGGKAFNYATGVREPFAYAQSQIVFETYAKMAVLHGMVGSNWSVLEAPALVQCALGLDDMELRNKYIKHYLSESTDKQESLADIAKDYKFKGDIYPETSQYSNGVANLSTNLMYIMTKYDPSLRLGHKYINIPWSLPRWRELVYPNGQLILLGDGRRQGGGSPYSYETAYALGKLDGVPELTERFGALIREAQDNGSYNRPVLGDRNYAVEPYYVPAQLLWCSDTISSVASKTALPRTDILRHAGVFLQRNLSTTGRAEDGLMLFVGGAAYVHGHATGMHIELYGKGEVLGNDPGHPGYGKDAHENYARLFAAHNTIIVNGSSCSEGKWVNLGINTVEKVAMEPEPWTEALSPLYSYSKTSFVDDKGDKAEAVQERTLSVIRTSPTTGYYVDIFRSKSSLPNEYHDYLYHNTADEVAFLNPNLKLNPTPERYMANANDPWVPNRTFRHPGWHWFTDVETSQPFEDDVMAIFRTKEIRGKSLNMRLFVTGDRGREYTRVMSPPSYQATPPYDKKPTPVVVIRKQGEAWDNPFAVVFEPTEGVGDDGSVISVDKITNNGVFKGLKVVSRIEDRTITQYIISQDKGSSFYDKELGLRFNGGFAIITLGRDSKLENIYLGEAGSFSYKKVRVVSPKGTYSDVYIDFTSVPEIKSNGNPKIKY